MKFGRKCPQNNNFKISKRLLIRLKYFIYTHIKLIFDISYIYIYKTNNLEKFLASMKNIVFPSIIKQARKEVELAFYFL